MKLAWNEHVNKIVQKCQNGGHVFLH